MRILIAYGTKRGATQGLAQMLAAAMEQRGAQVVTTAADDVRDLTGFDAVVVGGSLYMGRWHKDSVRMVKRLAEPLRQVPVWLFSSGPIGDEAAEHPDVPPVDKVAGLMERVGARGHMTFAGALAPDASGLIAAKMAQSMSGDWRDPEAIDAWAEQIVGSVQIDRADQAG
jgi:menaquinone-dependent protoporphyrinogen oxidase